MNHTILKEGLRPIESVKITHAARVVSISTHEVVPCSPRANLAYSFWLCWQWLRRKIQKSNV
jgi:predicted P-loop ATPase/GTPase